MFARYHRLQGQRRPDGERDGRARHAGDGLGRPGAASRRVSSPTATTRSSATTYVNLGMSYDCFTRTTTRNHYRVTQDIFRTLYDKGYLIEQTTLGAFSPATGRTLPDRYIEGTCPICGYAGGARRPVRQLRQPARPGRPDRPALDRRRLDARVPRDDAPVPRPARVRASGSTSGSTAQDALAAERPELLARARARAEAARDDARHRLGRPRAGRRLPRGHEADLRLVRRGDRLPLGERRVGAQPRHARTRGASGGRTRTRGHFYFMGKDNIVFHSVIWPAMLLGYGSGGELGAGRGDLHLPTNVVASEYLTMEGKKASTSRNLAIWVARLPRAATTPTRCATTSPPPARRRRTPTSRGTSSSAATTTSCSPTGATSSTARSSARTATSARCREPGELTDADTRAPRRASRPRSTTSARMIEQARFQRRDRRGDARRARSRTSTSPTRRRGRS